MQSSGVAEQRTCNAGMCKAAEWQGSGRGRRGGSKHGLCGGGGMRREGGTIGGRGRQCLWGGESRDLPSRVLHQRVCVSETWVDGGGRSGSLVHPWEGNQQRSCPLPLPSHALGGGGGRLRAHQREGGCHFRVAARHHHAAALRRRQALGHVGHGCSTGGWGGGGGRRACGLSSLVWCASADARCAAAQHSAHSGGARQGVCASEQNQAGLANAGSAHSLGPGERYRRGWRARTVAHPGQHRERVGARVPQLAHLAIRAAVHAVRRAEGLQGGGGGRRRVGAGAHVGRVWVG